MPLFFGPRQFGQFSAMVVNDADKMHNAARLPVTQRMAVLLRDNASKFSYPR
jgi:hypothetical protein